jgi:HK97 family phage major capsid protein
MDKRIEELRNLNLELEELKKRKEEIKRKALEHRSTITSDEVDEARAEVENINQKIAECEARQKELQKENEKQGEQRKMNDYLINNEKRDAIIASFKKEKRVTIPAQEVRSVLVASAGIAKPTKVNGIGEPFNTQVSILDQVQVVDMTGAGAFKESFLRTHSAATTKTDGEAQSESAPTFGTVTISPAEVAVTTYVSKELEKVTPLNYLEKVQRSALTALKVKLAGDIVAKIKTSVDDSDVPMFQTLVASAENKMLTGTATKTGAITESTLRNIVLSYGGDANVYGNAVLYLNKKDLIAFGDVRGTSEKKAVYEITPDTTNPNIGIIKDGGLSVPYCIVPTLTELSGTAQTDTAIQTMIYGSPKNFELALFGDYTIEVSRDYKFAEGLISVLGSVTAGGNVIVPNGFIVVTIPASGTTGQT